MALTRITKGVIKPNENYDTHNINSTGIVTAIGLDVNGNGDISGNLSVGGVLTYEDVTSIDSVGIITARNGIDCNGDIDVDGHTNLDNVSIAGITTFASSIYVADSIIHEGDTDTKIDFTTNVIKLTAANRLRIDFQSNGYNRFYGSQHSEATSSYPKGSSATYVHRFRDTEGDDTEVQFFNTNVKNTILSWNDYGNSTSAGNLVFKGVVGGSGLEHARFTGSGNFNLLRDLDVDGHTNLDNVSVAGVSTYTGAATFNGSINSNAALNIGANSHISLANGNWAGNAYGKIQHHSNRLYFGGGSATEYSIVFRYDGSDKIYMRSNGTLYPKDDSTSDLGKSATRWANVYADTYYGDGSNLTNVISGVDVKFEGASVGTGVTMLNFVGFNTVTAPVSGLSTITSGQNLTIGVRSGSAVEASLTGTSFNVIARSGGNISINI